MYAKLIEPGKPISTDMEPDGFCIFGIIQLPTVCIIGFIPL